MADIWFRFTDGLTGPDIASAHSVLSDAERERCDRFVRDRDRQTFAAAHALLRSALSFHERSSPPHAWVFDVGPHGKPCLAPGQSDLAFSLTHTAGLVACAVARVDSIGIDAESLGRAADANEIAERFFSPREARALEACEGPDHQARFIELWTLKEAYVKATGAGLSAPLNEFEFDLRGASGLQFSPPHHASAADWHFSLFAPSPHYRLAVAVQGSQRIDCTVRDWPPRSTAEALPPLRVSRHDG